jgi:hypothetical protein
MVAIALWSFLVASFSIETLDYQECKKIDFKSDKCEQVLNKNYITADK